MTAVPGLCRYLEMPAAMVEEHRAEPSIGSTVDGRYALRRLMARGGTGLVFEARQFFTKRIVAIKLLATDAVGVERHRDRLLREAHALTSVRHPGIVEVLDAGVCTRFGPYLVLEMLDGRPLDGLLLARQRLSVEDAVLIGRQICDALAWAHLNGVIHRDVKPSNVFISRERSREVVKVIDLGIAAVGATEGTPADRRLTQPNELLGTPEYMAPEQLFARSLDARCDQYALAVTLFESIAGTVPYAGTYPEVLLKVGTATTPPSLKSACAAVPAAVASAIERALAIEPSDRYPHMSDFGRALSAAVRTEGRTLALLGDATIAARAPAPSQRRPPTPHLISQSASAPQPGDLGPRVRKFTRVPYVTRVQIFEGEQTPLEGRCEDISIGGVLVVTARGCHPGASVSIRLALPITGEVTAIAATVRWARPARGRNAIGLEFFNMPKDALALIETYVTQGMANALPSPPPFVPQSPNGLPAAGAPAQSPGAPQSAAVAPQSRARGGNDPAAR